MWGFPQDTHVPRRFLTTTRWSFFVPTTSPKTKFGALFFCPSGNEKSYSVNNVESMSLICASANHLPGHVNRPTPQVITVAPRPANTLSLFSTWLEPVLSFSNRSPSNSFAPSKVCSSCPIRPVGRLIASPRGIFRPSESSIDCMATRVKPT